MKPSRGVLLFIGSAVVLIGVSLAAAAWAVVSGPIDPSSTAQALEVGLGAVGDLSAHRWQPAIAGLLMLLVWIGHQPFAGAFLNKLGRWHNPIVLGVGGALSAIADHLISGGPLSISIVMGILTPILATGAWEHATDTKDAPKEAAEEAKLAAVKDLAAAHDAETDPTKKAALAAEMVAKALGR